MRLNVEFVLKRKSAFQLQTSVLTFQDNRSVFNTPTKSIINSPWAKTEVYNIKKEVTHIVANVSLRVKR